MSLPAAYRLAVVQAGPAYLDRTASLERALHFISQAAEDDAQLVVFPETWFSGYPIWLDTFPGAALWDHPAAKEMFLRTRQSALSIPGPETAALCEAAKKHNLTLVLGANEAPETGTGNGSIFNSLLIIGPSGVLRVHHRKLMPTHGERLLHAPGDGHGLKSVDIDGLRMGGLICWEHWMPHTRQAMHLQGEHIHLALWPQVKELNHLASRHYALEGRCFVLAAGATMRHAELPGEVRTDHPDQNALLLHGGSALYAPDGSVLHTASDEDLLIWDIEDLDMALRERMALDASGHYNRPDVFDFKVDDSRR